MKTIFEIYESVLEENKDRLIDKIPSLTDIQKKEMKDFFKKRPNLENRFDWNKLNDISYDDFLEISSDYQEPINPDTVKELSDKRDEGNGIVSYEILDDLPGQIALREIVNTHWGKKADPWCIVKSDGEGGLSEEAWDYWEHYSSLPKRVAFKNGKLLAFMASDEKEPDLEEMFPELYDEWKRSKDRRVYGMYFDNWMEEYHKDLVDSLYDEEGYLDKKLMNEIWWDRNDEKYPDLEFAK